MAVRASDSGVRVDDMGEAALLVSFGSPVVLSMDSNRRARALRRELTNRNLPGVTEIVPSFGALLVCYDPFKLNRDTLIGNILDADLGAERVEVGRVEARRHLVPVRYGGEDGPDLDGVAHLHGITLTEVIRIHTSVEFEVGFLGFLPGFPYMAELPEVLATPRLAAPRTRVPAGSVGIAGVQTGIYPSASPGGWRIIGAAGSQLWDPWREPPALFAPGDRVRFTATAEDPEGVAPAKRPYARLGRPAFKVLQASGIATVQDGGRRGYAHLGLGPSGVFDGLAAGRANALVGNAPNAAVLELTWGGPALVALDDVVIALAGADLGCVVGGEPVPNELSWLVRRGTTIDFRGPQGRGLRAYLAVSGGIEVEQVLGSRSTALAAGFGGLEGRPLRAGDTLYCGSTSHSIVEVAGRYWPERNVAIGREDSRRSVIRFVQFEGPQSAGTEALEGFISAEWRLTERADRMGYQFLPGSGVASAASAKGDLLSLGVVRGAIQLPPTGTPYVLNCDYQTTGGYPLLGVVIQADWPVLAQLAPGSTVTFEPVNRQEAIEARRAQEVSLERGVQRLLRR